MLDPEPLRMPSAFLRFRIQSFALCYLVREGNSLRTPRPSEGPGARFSKLPVIGPLQDSVTWYGINYTGTQMTQWDFQNKGKSGWPGKNSFVLKVPLRHLRPSVIYSVPRDRILQRAY